MNITIIRHGETDYNVAKLLSGDPTIEVNLTKKGIAQAKRAKEYLKDTKYDIIYISQLNRTSQTLDYLDIPNTPVITDARLNDINSGFEGQPTVIYDNIRDSSPDPFSYRHEDGESLNDVYHKVEDFLYNLKQTNAENILIITSELIIVFIFSILDGIPKEKALKLQVKNCAINHRKLAKENHS